MADTGWGGVADDAFNAAMAIWLKKQGDKAPNQYPVQLTPADQWKLDQQKDIYGSLKNYVGQYLQGGQQTPDFHFSAPMFANEKFAGGLSMPKIDFSKIGGALGVAGGGATTVPTGATSGSGFDAKPEISGSGPDVFNKDWLSGGGDGPGGGGGIPQPTMSDNNPNTNVGATPGGINTIDPTHGGTVMPTGMQYAAPPNISAPTWGQVVAGVQQYGRAGIEIATAIATANPVLGAKGIIDGVVAYFKGKNAGGSVPPQGGGGPGPTGGGNGGGVIPPQGP